MVNLYISYGPCRCYNSEKDTETDNHRSVKQWMIHIWTSTDMESRERLYIYPIEYGIIQITRSSIQTFYHLLIYNTELEESSSICLNLTYNFTTMEFILYTSVYTIFTRERVIPYYISGCDSYQILRGGTYGH